MDMSSVNGWEKGNMIMGVGVEGGGGGQEISTFMPFLECLGSPAQECSSRDTLEVEDRPGWTEAARQCPQHRSPWLLTHSFMCVLSRASQIWSSVYWLKGSKFDLERNTEECVRDPSCTHTLRRLWGQSLNKHRGGGAGRGWGGGGVLTPPQVTEGSSPKQPEVDAAACPRQDDL